MQINRYKDRYEAGKILAQELNKHNIADGVILAIPRGGVVVGAEVATELNLSLDIIIPRKIGAPANPEIAIGAVTQDGTVMLIEDEYIKRLANIGEIDDIVQEQFKEIHRRMLTYRGSADYPNFSDKTLIVVDDGIATGFTVKAAIASLRENYTQSKILLAVPVAPKKIYELFNNDVNEIICPLIPDMFYAVGQFYDNFDQVSDQEVISLLHKKREKMDT